MSEQIDLFDHFESLPKEVQHILNSYEDPSYSDCEEMLKQLEPFGYTFEYGLDSIPYSLRRIVVNPKQELQQTFKRVMHVNINMLTSRLNKITEERLLSVDTHLTDEEVRRKAVKLFYTELSQAVHEHITNKL